MPTLYVQNVPADIYKALRKQAQANQRSMAAEVIALLKQHVVTEELLKRRRDALRVSERLRSQPPLTPGPFPSTEVMQREDRNR
jgi:plasmid stability protein